MNCCRCCSSQMHACTAVAEPTLSYISKVFVVRQTLFAIFVLLCDAPFVKKVARIFTPCAACGWALEAQRRLHQQLQHAITALWYSCSCCCYQHVCLCSAKLIARCVLFTAA